MYLDETAALCDLLLPQHHALERWDDLRPRAGVYSLMQPVMEPVFNTMATGDLLLRTAKAVGATRPLHSPIVQGAPPGPLAGAGCRTAGEGLCRVLARRPPARRCLRTIRPPPRACPSLVVPRCATPSPPLRGMASSSSPPMPTACSTTAAAPTSPGCWRTPTRSPRSPGTPGSRFIPTPPASSTCGTARCFGLHLTPRLHRSAGVRLSGHSPRRRGGAAGPGAHRVWIVRARPRRQRARPARRARRRLPALHLHQGFGGEDRRIQGAGAYRRQSAPAGAGHRRGRVSGGRQEGPYRPAGLPRRGTRQA